MLIFDLLDLFFDRSQIFVICVSSWDDYHNSYDNQIRKESSEFFVFLLIFDLLDLFFDRSQIFVIYVSSWDDYIIVVTMMKLGNLADIRSARFIFQSIANFCNMCFELRCYIIVVTMMKLENLADIRSARFIFQSIANFCNMYFELIWLFVVIRTMIKLEKNRVNFLSSC